MALNEIFKDADGISVPAATGALSGTPARKGILNLVHITDEGSVTNTDNKVNGFVQKTGGIGNSPGYASAKTSGSFMLEVTGAIAAWGDPVYIKTDQTLTTVAAGAFLFGSGLAVKNATKAFVHVRLLQPGQITANA